MLASLLLAAAAPAASAPEIAAYRALVEQDLRLATVGYRLAAANAKFCDKKARNPGWVLHDVLQYPDADAARAAFDFRRPVSVAALVKDGPAKRAGVASGDGLGSRNSVVWDWSGSKTGRASAERMEAVKAELADIWNRQETIEFGLTGVQGTKTVSLNPPEICASDFWVDAKSGLDAGADGNRVRVTLGMMIYTPDNDELAVVVAHEMSHNLLGHRTRLNGMRAGKTKAILATEIEADRLSVWLMANAGYDPQAAVRFWQRYGPKTGLGIFSDGRHLRWKNRIKLMQAEIELMDRAAKRDRLLPPPLLTGGQSVTP